VDVDGRQLVGCRKHEIHDQDVQGLKYLRKLVVPQA